MDYFGILFSVQDHRFPSFIGAESEESFISGRAEALLGNDMIVCIRVSFYPPIAVSVRKSLPLIGIKGPDRFALFPGQQYIMAAAAEHPGDHSVTLTQSPNQPAAFLQRDT